MISIHQPVLSLLLVSILEVSAQSGYIYQSPSLFGPSSPAPTFAPSIISQGLLSQPQARIVTSGNKDRSNLQFLNLGFPVIDNNYLSDTETYIVDGRVLKQYLVEENQYDDILPPDNVGSNPILLNDFANIFDKYSTINQNNRRPNPVSRGISQDFLRIQVSNGPTSLIQPVTRNHGPVALGSGSLGYIRRPNGSVFLGSGSLGYISNQQRVNDVNDARAPKGTAPGPTSFGDSVTPFI
ncbi:uncharacterized protein LOC119658433 [Hermetia illucens]|uniref:uncharacterized protein LOC119658433 n=1 Tax=Hermetia illucens TaxID=343691 RepID=UPI0018CC6A12|nr:uncharacterized protein LOC119658433 [Hermetia illucens]